MRADCAVINSGPLIALSLLNRLPLLPQLFSDFWIPEVVFQEVAVAGLGKPGASALQVAQWQQHIWREPLINSLLTMELDAGESAVISLAYQKGGMALIDERRGRRVAQQVYQLPVKGTAGVLVMAARQGIAIDIQAELHQLQASGYFVAQSVIDAAVRAVKSTTP